MTLPADVNPGDPAHTNHHDEIHQILLGTRVADAGLSVTGLLQQYVSKDVLDEDHLVAVDPHTGYLLESLLDAKGDIVAAGAADTPAKVTVGTDGQVLTADSTAGAGVAWKTGGSAGSNLYLYANVA